MGQYADFQRLYEKYESKGLVVLGFPCNQFGKQEPGDEASIKKFAEETYGVTFPLFSKVGHSSQDFLLLFFPDYGHGQHETNHTVNTKLSLTIMN